MRADAKSNDIVRAVVNAIEATFDRSRWMELGLATDSLDYITNHPRLLRGVDWGNPDYKACIIETVPIVLGKRRVPSSFDPPAPQGGPQRKFPNLATVEEVLNLRGWLESNDRALYAALYSGTDEVVIDDVQAAAARLSIDDVDQHAARIRRGLRDDPAQAIGSSKELLETVFKAVLGLHGNGRETLLDLPRLAKEVNVKLGFDATGHRGDDPGAEQRRRLFGSLTTIVTATTELRNGGFGTGHGGSQRRALDLATTRLVVSSAVALATFYIEAAAAEDGS
jgi:hypothetical protein